MVSHDIVVVGANIAGINTAHYLLKHTIPTLEAANKSTSYTLTLISPSTHFFWKIGAPRALINSELIPVSKIFRPIEDGFKQYSKNSFSFVVGSAVGLDESKKTITVQAQGSATKTVSYSSLIIATGTTSTSPLWTLHGSHETSIASIQEMHAALPKASTILIAGGGPAGVETAGKSSPYCLKINPAKTPSTGEIATIYPRATTTLLSGSHSLLPRLKSTIGSAAESKLKHMGVKTIHNVKVTSASPSPNGGKTTAVNLSDNTTRTVDVYIDATGGKPNASFLPASWLNDRGYVLTDPKTLRSPTATGIYAIGDVASYSSGSAMDATDPVRPLCSSVLTDLMQGGKEIPFNKSEKMTQVVPIGPKGGVGMVFGWKVPSLMVWAVKSRTFFVEMVEPTVMGNNMVKA